jgi:peroxiredoxin
MDMNVTSKLHPGQSFEPREFARVDGPAYRVGGTGGWQVLFVYRGLHCPICKGYLGKIKQRLEKFAELGIEVAAVSADSEAQARQTAETTAPTFPLLYGLDLPTMRTLGLYISEPRSPEETDHRFPEPGLFVINPDGVLQIVDVSNAPFVRPDLDVLLSGLKFVIDNDYPVRGTYR